MATRKSKSQKGIIQAFHKSKPEMKHIDYTTLSGSLGQYPAAWSNYWVTRPTRGTEYYSRIGNQVFSAKVELKFNVTRNSGGATVQRVMVMVLVNKDPANTATSASELFQATNLFDPFFNEDYRSNFRILYKRLVVLDSAVSNDAEVSISIPLKFVTKFSANGGTVTDASENSVELICWSDQSTNQPTLGGGSFRYWWFDN